MSILLINFFLFGLIASSIITLGGNRDQNMNTYSGKDYGREYKSYGNYASGSRVTMEKTKPKMPRVSSINERPIPYRSIDSSDRSPSAIVKSVKSKWIELPPQTRSYYSSSRPPSSQMMPMTSESQNIEMPNIDKILYEQNVLRNENDKISIDSLSNEFNIKQDYNNSNLDTNQIQMEIPFEIPKSSNLKSNGKLQTFITKDGLFGVLIPVEDLNIMKPVIESTKKKMTR